MKNILGLTIVLFSAIVHSQITPYNSWRGLVVFTNSTESEYGSTLAPGADLYTGYVKSLFDGMNQVYEDSYIDTRAQVAGVIWNKTFSDTSWGCRIAPLTHPNDYSANGLGRYIALLEKYSADAIIFLHHTNDTAIAGCAFTYSDAVNFRYAGYWAIAPDNLWLFAHEMGHVHSTFSNYDHCMGHRVAFDQYGTELGGPSPDSLSATVITYPWGGIPTSLIETTPWIVDHGFHTTMAYSDGGSQFCYRQFADNHDGVDRIFKTYHQGTQGNTVGWTGTFSNPAIPPWTHPLTDQSYPIGYDSVTYINRIKYIGDSVNASLTYTTYNRNFASVYNAQVDTIRNLNAVPYSLNMSPDMGIGPNVSDTQWVYSSIVAQDQVIIEPGFVFNGGHLDIKVGANESSLLKRSSSKEIEKRNSQSLIGSRLKVNYSSARETLELSIFLPGISTCEVSIFNSAGKIVWVGKFSNYNGQPILGSISATAFSKGLYLVRIAAGTDRFSRSFIKF